MVHSDIPVSPLMVEVLYPVLSGYDHLKWYEAPVDTGHIDQMNQFGDG
jgi:hypothetical protein